MLAQIDSILDYVQSTLLFNLSLTHCKDSNSRTIQGTVSYCILDTYTHTHTHQHTHTHPHHHRYCHRPQNLFIYVTAMSQGSTLKSQHLLIILSNFAVDSIHNVYHRHFSNYWFHVFQACHLSGEQLFPFNLSNSLTSWK